MDNRNTSQGKHEQSVSRRSFLRMSGTAAILAASNNLLAQAGKAAPKGMTRVSCLGWGTKHPFLVNDYDNPFWNEASMMQTNRGHMCRCNVFWVCAAGGERANIFGDKATLYMGTGGVHKPTLRFRMNEHRGSMYDLPEQSGGELKIPAYRQSDMLPEPMRHASGHGGSAVFISAEFVNALLEDREPSIDVYEALAMTVPGIVAHQSALKDGEQLAIPQYDPA